MEDAIETIAIDPKTAERILTDFLIENEVYDHFIYGLEHCSSREETVTNIKDFIKTIDNYQSAIASAFSWMNYTKSDYGKKHHVNWIEISRKLGRDFSKFVEKHDTKSQIIKALDIIN